MPRRSTAAAASVLPEVAQEFQIAELATVMPSLLNPRKRRTENDLDEEFLDSIRRHGVIEPIVCRPTNAEPGKTLEIVAGERRYRGSLKVGRTTIPLVIRDVTDEELIALALDENLRRRSMHPVDEAEALKRLQEIDRAYLDLDVLGKKFGKSASYMRDKLKLLRLPALIVDALDAHAITLKHAELIATLPTDQHAEALARCFPQWADVDENATKSTQVEKLIEKREWAKLAPQLLGTRDLAKWARDHGKADLEDETVQLQLVEELGDPTATGVDAAALVKSLAQLSTDDWLSDGEIKALGVLPSTHWRKVGKGAAHRCEHTKRGVLMHGLKFGRDGKRLVIVDVCCEKTCKKHWPELNRLKTATTPVRSKSSKPSASEAAARKREAKAAAERKAAAATWGKDEPIYRRALGAVLSRTKVDLVAYVTRRMGNYLKPTARDYGITLTPATALHVLELGDLFFGDRAGLLAEAKAIFGVTAAQLEAEFKKLAPKPPVEKKADAKPAAKKKGAAKK